MPFPDPGDAVSTDQKPRRVRLQRQPSRNKTLVLELARCEWIEKRQNSIALGPSGSGKAHIGLALEMVA